jgi:hypothetical protein
MGYTKTDADKLKNLLKAEVVKADTGTLGGNSLYILVCLEARDTWANGIMENSKYARFTIDGDDDKLELYSGGLRSVKFRKTKIKSIEDAAARIQKWIDEAITADARYCPVCKEIGHNFREEGCKF